jgi:hypothetical protein
MLSLGPPEYRKGGTDSNTELPLISGSSSQQHSSIIGPSRRTQASGDCENILFKNFLLITGFLYLGSYVELYMLLFEGGLGGICFWKGVFELKVCVSRFF